MADDERGSSIGDFIRSQRRRASLSLRQVADLAKVSNAYLSQIERGVYRPSAKVLNHLAKALDVSAETLYAKAGLLEEHPDDHTRDVEEAIRSDARLSPDQKEALTRVYRGFLAAQQTEQPA